MKKTLLFLIPNLIISANLFSMQSSGFHYVLKEAGRATKLVAYDHYVQPYNSGTCKLIGPWEDSLSEEFKSITQQLMLHFRAIEKITRYIGDIVRQDWCYNCEPEPGNGQMEKGLKLQIHHSHRLWLWTPFGARYFQLDRSVLNIQKSLSAFIKTETEIDQMEFSGFYGGKLIRVEKYRIISVDGEQLPEPIENRTEWLKHFRDLYSGTRFFIPQGWLAIEHLCKQNMKAAQFAICCALHSRLGKDSSSRILSQYLIRDIAKLLHPDQFMFLPAESKAGNQETVNS